MFHWVRSLSHTLVLDDSITKSKSKSKSSTKKKIKSKYSSTTTTRLNSRATTGRTGTRTRTRTRDTGRNTKTMATRESVGLRRRRSRPYSSLGQSTVCSGVCNTNTRPRRLEVQWFEAKVQTLLRATKQGPQHGDHSYRTLLGNCMQAQVADPQGRALLERSRPQALKRLKIWFLKYGMLLEDWKNSTEHPWLVM